MSKEQQSGLRAIDWQNIIRRMEKLLKDEEDHYQFLRKHKGQEVEGMKENSRNRQNQLQWSIESYRRYYNKTQKS